MKTLLVSFICLVLAHQDTLAQSDTTAVWSKIRSQEYTFIAQSATPLRGRQVQLTSNYDVRVSVDSIIAALPYFGRAYSATPGTLDGGIDFTSTKFDYNAGIRKKKWEINIKPANGDVNEMNLTVFENGKASLRVSSNSRQSIIFDGYIK